MATASAATEAASASRVSLGKSIWREEQQLEAKFPPLKRDLETDIVVVGAGVAGLSIAYNLVKAGKKVVVLENRVRGCGQTSSDAGVLLPWHDQRYGALTDRFGPDVASKVAASYQAALDTVARTVEAEGLDCGFEATEGYLIPGPGGTAAELRGEASAAVRAGVKGVTEGKLPGDGSHGVARDSVKFTNCAALDPVRYADGLAEAIVRAGGEIYEASRVRKTPNRAVITMAGHKVSARDAVVLATLSPITGSLVDSVTHVLALHSKQFPRRRSAIALRVASGSVPPGLYFDTASPPRLARLVKGSRGGSDTLLVAGEDRDQGMAQSHYYDALNRLETWAKEHWKGVGERVAAWNYPIMVSSDRLGLYGPDPTVGKRSYYVATGDCGRGVAHGTIAALVISAHILNQPCSFKDLYHPSRKLSGLPLLPNWSPRYYYNTIKSAASMILPWPTAPDIEDMAPDTGRVTQRHLRKVAVYNDENNVKHSFSGLCPHLGCLLQWNDVEKEWNCPCHGSCFSKEGENLIGPATIDMKRLHTFDDKNR